MKYKKNNATNKFLENFNNINRIIKGDGWVLQGKENLFHPQNRDHGWATEITEVRMH